MTGRIITRPDFDGIVCAALLKEVMGSQVPVKWVQPNQMQRGLVEVGSEDVVANLPLPRPCALWFDHHVSNQVDFPYKGTYRMAPSAARLVFDYFRDQIDSRFETLVQQADKIDAAQLNLDEILHPEKYPYILISMTIYGSEFSVLAYCDHLVELFRCCPVELVMVDPEVRRRCEQAMALNRDYEALLKRHTTVRGHVSITDLRNMGPVPDGNRFLVYSLFPQTVVNVKIFDENGFVAIKLGHSIVNPGCRVNLGKLLMKYGGGGHSGAGACRIELRLADRYIHEIIEILVQQCSDSA
jgi:hypothetical protein